MPRTSASKSTGSTRRIRPASNPDAREKQLISLAIDLVEKRLLDGSATSQETTHFLKLASSESRYKKALMQQDIELKKAKAEAIKAAENSDKRYLEALNAMRTYSGHGDPDEY